MVNNDTHFLFPDRHVSLTKREWRKRPISPELFSDAVVPEIPENRSDHPFNATRLTGSSFRDQRVHWIRESRQNNTSWPEILRNLDRNRLAQLCINWQPLLVSAFLEEQTNISSKINREFFLNHVLFEEKSDRGAPTNRLKRILSAHPVEVFIYDLIKNKTSWVDIIFIAKNRFALEFSNEVIENHLMHVFIQSKLVQLYNDFQNFISSYVQEVLRHPTHDRLLVRRIPTYSALTCVEAYFDEFNSFFPGITLAQYEQKAKIALESVNITFFPVSCMQEFIRTYLKPYLEGKIREDNEPQPHIPLLEQLNNFLIRQNPKRAFSPALIQEAVEIFVFETLSHVNRQRGIELSIKIYESVIHFTEISMDDVKLDIEDPLVNKVDPLRAERIRRFNTHKPGSPIILFDFEEPLVQPLLNALNRDFPGKSFSEDEIRSMIFRQSAKLYAL